MTAVATDSTARDLLRRWDAQQTAYIRHRVARFETIARVVAAICADAPKPRILDLAAGPGSLGMQVLASVPQAELVLVDKDPVLLAIAADITAADDRVTIAEVDLDDPEWGRHPAIAAGGFDAVVSSTALHWLRPEVLAAVYWGLAGLLRPGGIVLNGDHLAYDPTSEPTLRKLAAQDDQAVQDAAFTAGTDTWDAWWAAAEAVPAYAEAVRRRQQVWGERLDEAPPKVTLGYHLETLRSAGFAEAGTVWRYLDDHVLYAVR